MGWLNWLILSLVAVFSVVECQPHMKTNNRPSFLDYESDEVDSSEDGGEAGEKTTTCPCGWANKVHSRIINGTEAGRNEFPFYVAVKIKKPNQTSRCGGTIISKYHILTAAHCMTDAKTAYIVVGAHLKKEDEFKHLTDQIKVKSFEIHAKYDREIGWLNDIALLVLEKGIKFSQLVGPACLPLPKPQLQLNGRNVKIIGMGQTEYNGSGGSPVLLKINSKIVPLEKCSVWYNKLDRDSVTQLCTYDSNKDPCKGDSGGPIIWLDPDTNRYTLIGVVSYGKKCGLTGAPSVITRVQFYLNWIHKQIKASNTSKSKTCAKII